jgi:hypothetical protein
MTKTLALLAFALASGLGATSAAAPVDVHVLGVPGSSYGIYVSPSPDVGDVSLYVVGFSGMSLSPLPQISVLDSLLVGGPLGASLQIISHPDQNLVPEAGSELIRLATLTVVGSLNPVVQSGDDLFGFTVLNRA